MVKKIEIGSDSIISTEYNTCICARHINCKYVDELGFSLTLLSLGHSIAVSPDRVGLMEAHKYGIEIWQIKIKFVSCCRNGLLHNKMD